MGGTSFKLDASKAPAICTQILSMIIVVPGFVPEVTLL